MVLKGGEDGTGRKQILSDKNSERQERQEAISLYSTCTKREQKKIDTNTNPEVFSLHPGPPSAPPRLVFALPVWSIPLPDGTRRCSCAPVALRTTQVPRGPSSSLHRGSEWTRRSSGLDP